MKYNIRIYFKNPIDGKPGREIEHADCYGFDRKNNLFKAYRCRPLLDYTIDFSQVKELIIKEERD